VRTFVFAYDRFETMTTSRWLGSWGHTVLCHAEADAARFRSSGTVGEGGEVVATGNPRGLAYQRNTALDAMDEGEWALFLVDDLVRVTALDTYWTSESPLPITMAKASQRHWTARFATPWGVDEWALSWPRLLAACDSVGANLAGWCGIDNPPYRRRHWGVNVLADGRAWLVRKTDLRFDLRAQMVDDVAWTALNIETFGAVVVDRWICPQCGRYTGGGFGSIASRMDQKREECAYLVERFPGLVRFADKPGWDEGCHVRLRAPGRMANALA
jgi:hypothetical protein